MSNGTMRNGTMPNGTMQNVSGFPVPNEVTDAQLDQLIIVFKRPFRKAGSEDIVYYTTERWITILGARNLNETNSRAWMLRPLLLLL